MSLVTIQKVSLGFIGKQVFHEIGFHLEPGDRVGLVGPNGSGKTSLLRLIMEEILPDSGEVRVAKGYRIGYLPQDVQQTLSGPLLQAIYDAVPGRKTLQQEQRRLEKSLEALRQRQDQAKLAERLAEVHDGLISLDYEFPRHQAEKILSGLGFLGVDLDKPVSYLSGGWKARAVIASLLYQNPDLLLMDEPTNHLDMPSVRWLEQFLQEYKGGMVLVSHDREFLNRQIQRIVSFEPEGMRAYSGNYDFYLKAREEERKTLEAKARRQEQKIKEAQKFIDRFRAKASKARQAQSKIKLVEKIALVEKHHQEKTIHFTFPEVPGSGREVISIKGVSKGFGQVPLYRNLDLTVLRAERIGIIGPNGSGKTTLLRMLAGEIMPDEGQIKLGHQVTISYFAQHHSDTLNLNNTVIQEVYQVVPHETVSFVRGVCGAFLFSGDDVDKVTGVLSGGEKARVVLAKLLVKPGNLMIMDEPTNHLDIASSEKLINALAGYTGTMVFVSHNQSFVNQLATKIWDIREGKIVVYPGTLDEYYGHLARLEQMKGAQGKAQEKFQVEAKPAGPNGGENKRVKKGQDRKAEKRRRAQERQKIYDTLKPILSELDRLEKRIADLESEKKGLEIALADPGLFLDKKRSVPLLHDYKGVQEMLNRLLFEWEKRQEHLESTRLKLGLKDE